MRDALRLGGQPRGCGKRLHDETDGVGEDMHPLLTDRKHRGVQCHALGSPGGYAAVVGHGHGIA